MTNHPPRLELPDDYPAPQSPRGWSFVAMPWWMAPAAILIQEGFYWAMSPVRLDSRYPDGGHAYELLDSAYRYLFDFAWPSAS